MWRGSLAILGVACIVGGGLAAAGLAWRPELPAVPTPGMGQFTPRQLKRGADLAAIGDCAVCHTAEGGPAFAGGRPLPTPFGTLYSTNITPDAATGIGAWSLAAFVRAMRQGVDRAGRHLYPALPYEHYTHVADDDLAALYAFLMTRPAVSAPPRQNRLVWPLGYRPLLAGWKLLFLHEGAYRPDAGRDARWNRGAYLVEGLGHCGGCHTPRNLAGGEERGRPYAGGLAEGWTAPPLDRTNPAPVPWTADSLYDYLRTGSVAGHGTAAGPMAPVAHSLATVPEDDVRAIATYVAGLMAGQGAAPPVDRADDAARRHPAAAALFAGACAGCHDGGAPMLAAGRAGLGLVTALQLDRPTNAVRAILQGLQPAPGLAGPTMPPFAASLTDDQIADLAAYLRTRFSDRPDWTGLAAAVAAARKEGP